MGLSCIKASPTFQATVQQAYRLTQMSQLGINLFSAFLDQTISEVLEKPDLLLGLEE